MRSKRQRKTRNGRMGAVRADLDALQKDMRGLVSDVGGVATREVRGAMDLAVDRLETLSTESLAGVRDAVRHQPLKACAISLGAGALIGALLMR